MALTVHLSGYLKPFSGGETEVRIEENVATVADALDSIWVKHPALRDRVLTETGEIRQHVNIFVGNKDVKRRQGLATELDSPDVHIFNAISGG